MKWRAAVAACAIGIFTALPVSGEGASATGSDGVTVTLPRPAQRVIALAPHLAENLFAAGAGDALIATVEYSDYPSAARALPRIGGYNSLSIEAIIAQQPDLVLAWGSGTGSNIVRRLRDIGIPVYSDEIRRLADIPASLRALGRLTGKDRPAAHAASRFERELAALRESSADKTALGVFYQIWHDPLQTIGGAHLISEVIALCGGYNIFDDAQGLAPRISRESVLLRNPDVIVASGSSRSVATWLSQWRDIPGLSAVQAGALYTINPDVIERPTPRLLAGAGELCERLDTARASVAGRTAS
ncbi:MAG: cobalamin-binding protein [Chromatocurvus sp.]